MSIFRIRFVKYTILNPTEIIPKYELELAISTYKILSYLFKPYTITLYGSLGDWRVVPGFKKIKNKTILEIADSEFSRLEYERQHIVNNKEKALSYQEKLDNISNVLKKVKNLRSTS